MYTPPRFRVTDLDTLHQFIEEHSFATVVSVDPQDAVNPVTIEGAHLPLLLRRDAGKLGHLFGHLANANKLPLTRNDAAEQSLSGQRCLVIFSGPHAYVSPGWYEEQDVVPTWNYIAVHAHGTLHIEDDPSICRQTLRDTVDLFESDQPRPWSIDQPSEGYIDGLANAITTIRIEIDRLEGNWKLNQHHPPGKRAKVANALRVAGGDDRMAIADAMESIADD